VLQITIPAKEFWDEKNERFISVKSQTLTLEHSLVSVSKWEAKWKIPFISKESKTPEQTIDYIRCMTLTQNVDPNVYNYLSIENFKQINEYIESPMTATVIHEHETTRKNSEIVTSELIYYWMIALQIPFECQKWHLNRLFTLIRICGIKNQPPKKIGRRELLSRNAALNAARRQKLGTTG
jgi:hypothetical protein